MLFCLGTDLFVSVPRGLAAERVDDDHALLSTQRDTLAAGLESRVQQLDAAREVIAAASAAAAAARDGEGGR